MFWDNGLVMKLSSEYVTSVTRLARASPAGVQNGVTPSPGSERMSPKSVATNLEPVIVLLSDGVNWWWR